MLVEGWIDVHAHFYPPESEEQIQARFEAMKQACWTSAAPPRWDPESTLAYMDRTGIAMQMLSNVPKKLPALRSSNDYGASLVRQHPSRFGLLAALPTDDPTAALEEIDRAYGDLHADGFTVTCQYNGVYLSDPRAGTDLAGARPAQGRGVRAPRRIRTRRDGSSRGADRGGL